MDTMTLTKIVGGFCGTFLIFLLGKWGAELVYHGGGGHDDEHKAAYVIETGGDDSSEEAVEVDFSEVLAAADVSAGEKVFKKCQSCHKVEDGVNGTGPHLFGVVGRTVQSVEGYAYSGALAGSADIWSAENLNAFLESPKGFASGTTMSFSGLRKVEDRANVIAYLQSVGQ